MTDIIEISYETFLEKFGPIENFAETGTDLFETYGSELAFIKWQPEQYVWTLLCEGEDMSIVSGYHYVNRMNYLVTKNAWTIPIQLNYLEQ